MLARWIGTVVVVAVGCGGCGGGGETSGTGGEGGSGGSAPAFDACPVQHADGDVIVCDEAFATAPFVHLPPAADGVDYMALRACSTFVDRAGVAHTAASGLALCEDSALGGGAKEGVGHAFALYRTTLDGAGKVTAFERWAVIDEKNLLAPFAKASIDGLVSKRLPDGKYELDATLPVRVTMGEPTVVTSKTDGTSVYEIAGTIENLTTSVAAADGSCTPALAGGASDPFPGATSVVLAFSRVPSMHVPGDDEAVFDVRVDGASGGSCMSPSWFIGPDALIAASAPMFGAYQGAGHGTPGYIPSLTLDIVHGGGGACVMQ